MVDFSVSKPAYLPKNSGVPNSADGNRRPITADSAPQERAWDGVDRRRHLERRLRRAARMRRLEMRLGRDRRGNRKLNIQV